MSSDLEARNAAIDGVFELADAGNAERLVARHGQDLRYVPGLGWLIWDKRRWSRDRTGALQRLAKLTAQAIYNDAANCGDDDERKRILAWAHKSLMEPRLRAMVSLATTERPVVALPEQLDADPWQFTVLNGTIQLKTGELRAHDPADLITKLAPVTFRPGARSSAWEEFIDTTTGGDAQLSAFLQSVVGYTLTGDTREEVLLFAHGPAATGKSTFLESVKSMLGDCACTADFETFLRRRGDAGVRNDIARLAGARMVVSIEVDDGKQLAEGLIKALTGGDTVAARYLYSEAFEFTPRFKLWLAANHRPRVRADDEAMWRRIIQIPFTNAVPEGKRDPTLKARFKTDPEIKSAILAWAVQGCLDWQRNGLAIPESVRAYTAEYRTENDALAEWIADECQLGAQHWTATPELRAAYEHWCEDAGSKPLDAGRAWGNALKAHGCERAKRHVGHGWKGITLTPVPRSPT
ncbi:MAG: phage/plasmid primase, P4 family [Actinomycetota bacterium]|nr:phage/plasmid primase, P4 family [Actinomycetota bacterium]